jgi:hypothetical protein
MAATRLRGRGGAKYVTKGAQLVKNRGADEIGDFMFLI